MNKRRAIEILNKQKAKIDHPDHYNDENWVFQTASYIKDIFGEDSTEYIFISQFRFDVKISVYEDKEVVLDALKNKEIKAKKFIDNCIETLDQRGLPKIKGNFLQKLNDPWLIAILILVMTTIGTVAFLLGQYTSNVQNIELKRDNQQLKLLLEKSKIDSNTHLNLTQDTTVYNALK